MENTIRLIDDLDMPRSISLNSLSTQFVSAEDTKRGKVNVVEREEKNSKSNTFDFNPFDFENNGH